MNYKALSVTLVILLFSGVAGAQKTITKCQDKDGKWHYGDFASEACATDSTVTEIDQRGLEVRETDAPPTQEELDAAKEAERQARLEAEREAEQQEQDNRLLQTYDSADAIINARDEHVAALDLELEGHRLFRQDLVDEKEKLEKEKKEGNSEKIDNIIEQIRQYDEAIQALENERRSTIEHYDTEFQRYRALTDG